MFITIIRPLLEADPQVSGKAIEAAMDQFLTSHGLPNTVASFPVRFKYRVKEAALVAVYGPRKQWYAGVLQWAHAVTEADNYNAVTIDNVDGAYFRSFICTSAMRRIAERMALRPIVSIDAAHCMWLRFVCVILMTRMAMAQVCHRQYLDELLSTMLAHHPEAHNYLLILFRQQILIFR